MPTYLGSRRGDRLNSIEVLVGAVEAALLVCNVTENVVSPMVATSPGLSTARSTVWPLITMPFAEPSSMTWTVSLMFTLA